MAGEKELRSKLRRVRDAIKYAANSEGGLVAEIDFILAGMNESSPPEKNRCPHGVWAGDKCWKCDDD